MIKVAIMKNKKIKKVGGIFMSGNIPGGNFLGGMFARGGGGGGREII